MIRFLLVSAQIAVRALGRNRMRTVLTMLGVVIGVAAVIAMVSLGTGARGSVETSLKSAGTNIIQVSAGNFTRNGESMNIASGLGSASTLTVEDADAIRQLSGVQHVASGVRNRAWVASAHRKFFTQVRGVQPSLGEIHGWTFLSGKFTDAPDAAVMGRAASRELFGEGFDPVGEKITIGDRAFTVSGYFRIGDSDQDETVFIPLAAGQALLNGIHHLHTITLSVDQAGDATRVAMAVTDLLRERHSRGNQTTRAAGLGGNQLPGGGMSTADDFTVKTQAAANVTKGLYTSVAAFALANMPKLDEVTLQEMSSTLSRAGSTMTALLGSIAAISLIVGGIGIMNIMLVSVTERTKEIGIRLAVGARRRDVLLQFLVEAMVMSLIGGVLGVAIGLATAEGLTAVLDWPTEVSLTTVAAAFAIAALVGIVFGYLRPGALRASIRSSRSAMNKPRITHEVLKQRLVSNLARAGLFALALLAVSLAIGLAGYHWLAPMPWMDAFVNAAMLLGGMGPVDPLTNDEVKLFAGTYAMYCGVVFIATAGLLIVPVAQHVLHRFHLDQDK